MWSLVSSFYYEQQNIEKAVSALDEASKAPRFDDYFGKHLEQIQSSLFNSGIDEPLLETLVWAMDTGVRLTLEKYQSMVGLCQSYATENSDLARSCLDFGIRAESHSSTLINAMQARALQEVTHRSIGNIEAANAIDARSRNKGFLREYNDASKLLGHDDRLAWEWFQRLIAFGEIEAQEYLVEEARLLSSDPNYNPCR